VSELNESEPRILSELLNLEKSMKPLSGDAPEPCNDLNPEDAAKLDSD
jgi:hypothetical protein